MVWILEFLFSDEGLNPKGYNKLVPLDDDLNGNFGSSNLSVITTSAKDEENAVMPGNVSTSYVTDQLDEVRF